MTQLHRFPLVFLCSLALVGCASSNRRPSGSAVEKAVKSNSVDVLAAELAANFDPCEEIRRQLAESRRAFSHLGASDLIEQQGRSELALRETEAAADASRALARRFANDYLAAQKVVRRVEAQRSDEADAFCREVLELSGIGARGSLTKSEARFDTHWEAFTVLEDPPSDVYYLEEDEDLNSGERSRIALQETIFTEFPKYWDRTRETRDRLNLATLELATTLDAKVRAEEDARVAHEKIHKARERFYASCESAQRLDTSIREMIELERSLDRCGGGEGLAGRLQRIEARLDGLDLRLNEAASEFDRTCEEVAIVAPPGYRRGTEKHLDGAWAALEQIHDSAESIRGSLERALTAFANDNRDKAREHATRAQRGCNKIEESLANVGKFFDRARFAANEGMALYFDDGPDARMRNAALSRMDLDNAILESLRAAVAPAELDAAWDEMEIWVGIPAWLSSFEQEAVVRVPSEAIAKLRELHQFLQQEFRPCEPMALGTGVLQSFQASGHARTEQAAYQLLGETCGLMRRLGALLAEA